MLQLFIFRRLICLLILHHVFPHFIFQFHSNHSSDSFCMLSAWHDLYNCGCLYSSPFLILKNLASFMACFPDVPLLTVGDFINYIDPMWVKLPGPLHTSSTSGRMTPFACLLGELGLMDVWKIRLLDVKCSHISRLLMVGFPE